MLRAPAYLSLCAAFFILIGIGLAYSYFFYPNAHPLECSIRAITGRDCPTCGFSRSFSCYTHAEFSAGKVFNPLSFRPFVFFVLQFLWRGLVWVLYLTGVRRSFPVSLIRTDAMLSILFFLWAFLPVAFSFAAYF